MFRGNHEPSSTCWPRLELGSIDVPFGSFCVIDAMDFIDASDVLDVIDVSATTLCWKT